MESKIEKLLYEELHKQEEKMDYYKHAFKTTVDTLEKIFGRHMTDKELNDVKNISMKSLSFYMIEARKRQN